MVEGLLSLYFTVSVVLSMWWMENLNEYFLGEPVITSAQLL